MPLADDSTHPARPMVPRGQAHRGPRAANEPAESREAGLFGA